MLRLKSAPSRIEDLLKRWVLFGEEPKGKSDRLKCRKLSHLSVAPGGTPKTVSRRRR